MRETKTGGWMALNASDALTRGLRLTLVALGIGLVVTSGVARAQEAEEDDDRPFEDKLIEKVMTGLAGTTMDNRGIDYRERSPLVVPPRIDLPPPVSAAQPKIANWPKDPDEARRKAAIARRKKENRDPIEAARPLTPSELNAGRTASAGRTGNDPIEPGVSNNPSLSPTQLGFDGKITSFFRGNSTESVPFKGEPTRDSLTQPPAGYQTPSPNFAYGTGPKESLNKEYNPAAGKYGE